MSDLICHKAQTQHQQAVDALWLQYQRESKVNQTQLDFEQSYLVTLDQQVIALAIKGETLEQHTLIALYVLPDYRRQGYGAMLARYVFRQFPGDWQIKVNEDQADLNAFWQKTLAEFEYGYYEQSQILDPVDDMVALHTFSV